MNARNYSKTYNFNIKINPNLKGFKNENLKEQFELTSKIMNKTIAVIEAVLKIHTIKSQIATAKNKITSSNYKNNIRPFL
jgi:hypothetical protein